MARPLVQFVIGGVQKAGTTALAHYLGRLPGVVLPSSKEAHVFDDPRFDATWDAARIEAEYAAYFPPRDEFAMHGDATPIYLYHPAFVQRLAGYNPRMKWIILLRDPVDRAISQFYMQRSRGEEALPLWAALLAEPFRLLRDRDDFSVKSSMRRHSYVSRGRYRHQLSVLFQHFPQEQVLVLKSADLLAHPSACMERVCLHLGLPAPAAGTAYPPVFQGNYPQGADHRLVRWAVRLLFRNEIDWLNGTDPDHRLG